MSILNDNPQPRAPKPGKLKWLPEEVRVSPVIDSIFCGAFLDRKEPTLLRGSDHLPFGPFRLPSPAQAVPVRVPWLRSNAPAWARSFSRVSM